MEHGRLDAAEPGSLEPGRRGCTLGGRYHRVVEASLIRVWENVFDWEHLPWLHAQSFEQVELVERGAWGWQVRARLAAPRGPGKDASPSPVRDRDLGRTATVTIRLRADRRNRCYVSETLEGPGAGTEIWTFLERLAEHRTGVAVQFWLPTQNPLRAERLGQRLAQTYRELWDQDEAMMRARTQALARRREGRRKSGASSRAERLELLWRVDELQARLPVDVEWRGEQVRICEAEGRLVAFSLACPHMLGPLEPAPDARGVVQCPWHGYRFAIASGRSCDGHGLALERLRVAVDPGTGRVWLEPRHDMDSANRGARDLEGGDA